MILATYRSGAGSIYVRGPNVSDEYTEWRFQIRNADENTQSTQQSIWQATLAWKRTGEVGRAAD
jgi:hypothetical protein